MIIFPCGYIGQGEAWLRELCSLRWREIE